MASVIYLRGRSWRLRQGDDGKGRDLSKRIHSGWKTGGTEEKLADLNTYWISTHETQSLRPGDLHSTILVCQSYVFFLIVVCSGVCPQHRSGCTAAWTATSSFSTWPGSPTRWSSSPSQQASPRFWLHRLLVRQKHSTKKKTHTKEHDTIHRALSKKWSPDCADKDTELCQRRYSFR